MWFKTTLSFLVGLLVVLYTFVAEFMGIIVGYVLWLDLRSTSEAVILAVVMLATGLIWLAYLLTDAQLLGRLMRKQPTDPCCSRWVHIGDVASVLASIPVWLGVGYILT